MGDMGAHAFREGLTRVVEGSAGRPAECTVRGRRRGSGDAGTEMRSGTEDGAAGDSGRSRDTADRRAAVGGVAAGPACGAEPKGDTRLTGA
ncbi:hypothetical protein EAO69_07480 [Streptomyces sp. me109]|nr:hypothetical protein EAO69_07480 [Streptomyces sp. me109]